MFLISRNRREAILYMPFMNRALYKEIMMRTRLQNNFLKDRREENKRKYSQ